MNNPRRLAQAELVTVETDDPIAAFGTKRYYNRELSWLQFNRRVLEESENLNHPLLERLRFLSIASLNLDEFYMVRVAGLVGQINASVNAQSPDGLTPGEQLKRINEVVAELTAPSAAQLGERSRRNWTRPASASSSRNIYANTSGIGLSRISSSHVFPILTPIAIDPAHPFPFIPRQGFVLGLECQKKGTPGSPVMHSILPIPSQLDRFIRLPVEESRAKDSHPPIRFIRLESLVASFADRLFHGYEVKGIGGFRVLRDSELEISEKAEDLVLTFEAALRKRRRGSVIRLEIEASMPELAAPLRAAGA